MANLTIDSRGRYAASSRAAVGEILVYDPSGKFDRTIGRRGGGPGEFQTYTMLHFGPGDTLHVLEQGTGRYSVFGPSLQFVRSVVLPNRAFEFALGMSGRLVVAAPLQTDTRRVSVQVFAPSGERLAAFDETGAAEDAARGADRRFVAVAPGGEIWTLHADRYEIRSFGADGAPRHVLEAIRPWISGEALPVRLDPSARPPGQMSGLAVDPNGLIWIFATVADATWRPVQRAGDRPDIARLYDTIIEVIDPRTGTLVGVTRVDDVVFPLRAGQVYGVVSLPGGAQQIQVWNLNLQATR